MDTKRLFAWLWGGLLVLFVGSLLLGQLLGQPILLSFVETGSMEPEIETGHGFVAIPAELTGEPQQGDVVVFESQQIQGGELTTHRIVGETEAGFITQGDNNPVTDQDGGEPPVQEAQIVAVALQFNGEVVTIPHLGTAVTAIGTALDTLQRSVAGLFGLSSLAGTQGLAYLLLGLSLVAFAYEFLFASTPVRSRARASSRDAGIPVRLVLVGFAVLVMLSAAMAMTVPAGTDGYDVVTAEFDSDRPLVIQQGSSEEFTYGIGNGGVVPVHTYLEPRSDRIEVDERYRYVEPRSSVNATITVDSSDEIGLSQRYVTQHRYLAIVPHAVIEPLHDRHPWLATGFVLGLLGGGTYALGRLLVGTGRVRSRSRSRSRPSTGARGLLRRLYR